ncbi:PAS domain-containing hybrid sensor histidine kinase/response regulator [Gramella sp. BOM4]|nr:PAS domain-containing hybrid sensor histidine kinase/response regulator [Christiangramia bathymodioli]
MDAEKTSNNRIHESPEDLYHEAPCGYISFTGDAVIYNANKTVLKWLQYSREEIIDKLRVHDLLSIGSKIYFDTNFFPLILMQGYVNEVALEIKRKDGSNFPVLINVKKVKVKDTNENCYWASLFDISDRKKYERELLTSKLKAEQDTKTKTEFLNTISHEIRTPLNAILGIGNLLAKTSLDPKQKEFVDILRLSSENLLMLVNNLLDLSKLEANSFKLEEKAFAIRTLVNSLVHSLEIKAREKNIELYTEVDENLPNYIAGDPIKLNQILTNLLGNAIKFTTEGHVKLGIYLLGSSDTRLRLKFRVSDTGTGIPEDKLENIFQEFSQANFKVDLEKDGTGLGLSICKKLLKMHGSEIKVKSEVGRGSEFSFEIDYKKFDQRNSKFQKVHHLKEKMGANFSSTRLLVVEDNPINNLVISEYLKDWKINFDTVEDGQAAIAAVRKKKYDVILMDLHLPFIDGFEASSTIRNIDLEKQPVILALSASNKESIQNRLTRAGIDDFISKPFGPEDLHRILSNYVVSRQRGKANYTHQNTKECVVNKEEVSNDSFDLSGLIKMANNKPEFLKKFVLNTCTGFKTYSQDFKKAIQDNDPSQVSELLHKSTMSVFYIKADRLVKLLNECKCLLENEEEDYKNIKSQAEKTSAEFERIITGLEKFSRKL